MHLLKIQRLWLVLGISMSVALVAGFSLQRSAEAQPLAPATLSSWQLDVLHISGATSIADAADAQPASVGVTRANAIVIAAARVGRTDTPVGVLHGRAPRYVSEASRGVWVVLFDGGDAPGDGPSPGIAPTKMSLTGVIIDDQTGEVLRWFMV